MTFTHLCVESVIIAFIIMNTYRRRIFLSKTVMSNRCQHRRCVRVFVGWCCAVLCLSSLLTWVQLIKLTVHTYFLFDMSSYTDCFHLKVCYCYYSYSSAQIISLLQARYVEDRQWKC